MSLMSA